MIILGVLWTEHIWIEADTAVEVTCQGDHQTLMQIAGYRS